MRPAQMIANTGQACRNSEDRSEESFTVDDDVNVGTGFGINAGLAPAPGLGPTIGFGWYAGDLTLSGVSGDAEVGRPRVRPLMAGIGYTWVNGRVATGVSINAGISFNSIRLNDRVPDVVRHGTDVRVDASNSFAARPQFRSSTPSPGRSASTRACGYFFTEFNNVIETPFVRFENQWDASSFNIFVGALVYRLQVSRYLTCLRAAPLRASIACSSSCLRGTQTRRGSSSDPVRAGT